MSRHAQARQFRAEWDIKDLDRRQADLVTEALTEVPDLLYGAHVAQVGPWQWRIETGERPALVGVCDVEPWPGRPGRGRHA